MYVMPQIRPESKLPLCAIQLKSEAGTTIIKNSNEVPGFRTGTS